MNRMLDAFLVWWLKSGRYGWSRLRRRLFERGYVDIDLPTVSSLEEIENCLKQITWTMDGPLHLFDSISYPQITWKTKKDDCDGFATLACELLASLDDTFQPVLVTALMHPVRRSHTVCVFHRPEGGLGFFDNASLRNDSSGYADVIGKITQSTDSVICWDVRTHRDFERLEFHDLR